MMTIDKRLTAHVFGLAVTAPILGTLIAGPAFAQSANVPIDAARERAIQQCMALQHRDPHDGYEGKKGGGLQWHYRTCMFEHGQPE